MLRLQLVRHGETASSREDRYCGDLDLELSPAGHRMAESLANRFRRSPPDAIWASPKLRARQTAEPIGRALGVEVVPDDGLREISYGDWEGLHRKEAGERDPGLFAAWEADPAVHAPPGGESGRQIEARVLATLARIHAAHPVGEVVVISHKATIRVLICSLLGIDLSRFRDRIDAPTGTVSTVRLDTRGPLLERLADASHFPPDLRLL